ncbi:cadherin EGF LAG seven-pass G-type receptor 1-like [Diadema antillarum]|uniref:cadherin EGF LAG seven-pass G-type receptor 1-like n=1 Tax=Diadema antillarum TaxID=105358 RepID=UPI003A87344E
MDFFAIDSQTGDISLLRELDYENALTACNITMQAVQVNDCTMIGEATLIVTVNNVNECPRFVENEFNAEISPDDPFLLQAGSLERLMIGVTDEDLVFQGNFTSDPPDAVKLSLVESTDNGRFVSYFITLSDPSSITADTTIQLFVSDNTTDVPCPQAVANISVSVLTVGLAPDFSQPEYSGLVAENAMIGDIVANVSAVNSDGATAGIVYYLQLVSQGGEFIFNVDPDSGEISVANDTGLDAESVHQFTLLVEARDESGPYYRSSFASVIIDVLDINEFSPSFDGSIYEAEIEEEMIGGSCVLTVQASDSDIDSELQYSIDSSNVPFNISSATGEITTARRLDLEDPTNTEPYYNITVIVSDGTFDDSTYVLITVLDVNDNAPSFFGDEPFDISIPENEMDTIAFNITAYDADETSFVMYQLNDPMDDDRFSLDNVTGTLTITGPFDYETEKEFLLVVVASDTEFSTQTTVVVSITDVNDNAPQFTSTCPFAEVEEGVELGTAVCQVVAEDADDDGMAAVNYTITGGSGMGMFEISDTGLISTATADLDRETTSSFTLEITASDYGTPVLSNTTIVNVSLVDVNDNPPLFEMTTDNIFVEVDDMNAVPTRLYSVKATDEDLSPFDIIQCEQQTDKSSFLVLTSEGC